MAKRSKKNRRKGGGSKPSAPATAAAATPAAASPPPAEPSPPAPSGGDGPPPKRGAWAGDKAVLALILLPILAIGLYLSGYLTWYHTQVAAGLSPDAACDFGGRITCGGAVNSDYAVLFGNPISLYGATAYVFLIGLLIYGRVEKTARWVMPVVAVMGALSVLYSAFLAFITFTQLESICPYCLGMYAVNIATLVLAVLASNRPVGELLPDVLGSPKPLGIAAAVGFVALFIGIKAHDGMYAAAVEEATPEELAGVETRLTRVPMQRPPST